jgi:6-phosphofructokinase 1
MVDVHSTRYAIARRYMIRLRKDDFEDPHELAKFAATCGMSLSDFRDRFGYLVENELPPIVLVPSGHRDGTGPGSGSYFEGETL